MVAGICQEKDSSLGLQGGEWFFNRILFTYTRVCHNTSCHLTLFQQVTGEVKGYVMMCLYEHLTRVQTCG